MYSLAAFFSPISHPKPKCSWTCHTEAQPHPFRNNTHTQTYTHTSEEYHQNHPPISLKASVIVVWCKSNFGAGSLSLAFKSSTLAQRGFLRRCAWLLNAKPKLFPDNLFAIMHINVRIYSFNSSYKQTHSSTHTHTQFILGNGKSHQPLSTYFINIPAWLLPVYATPKCTVAAITRKYYRILIKCEGHTFKKSHMAR